MFINLRYLRLIYIKQNNDKKSCDMFDYNLQTFFYLRNYVLFERNYFVSYDGALAKIFKYGA